MRKMCFWLMKKKSMHSVTFSWASIRALATATILVRFFFAGCRTQLPLSLTTEGPNILNEMCASSVVNLHPLMAPEPIIRTKSSTEGHRSASKMFLAFVAPATCRFVNNFLLLSTVKMNTLPFLGCYSRCNSHGCIVKCKSTSPLDSQCTVNVIETSLS